MNRPSQRARTDPLFVPTGPREEFAEVLASARRAGKRALPVWRHLGVGKDLSMERISAVEGRLRLSSTMGERVGDELRRVACLLGEGYGVRR